MVVRGLPYPLSPHSDKTVVLSVQSGLASRLSDVSALHAGMRFKYLLYTFYGGFSNQLMSSSTTLFILKSYTSISIITENYRYYS